MKKMKKKKNSRGGWGWFGVRGEVERRRIQGKHDSTSIYRLVGLIKRILSETVPVNTIVLFGTQVKTQITKTT